MKREAGASAQPDAIAAPIESPFLEWLGIQFVRLDGEGAELRLPIRAQMLNSGGMVHGGVYASLADAALASAIYHRKPADHLVITTDINCRYLRAARSGTLLAVGRLLHIGRRTAVAEAEISVDGVLQVKASGSFMIVPRPQASTASD